MAENFLSTLCVGDEVGIETFGMLRIAKVAKITSLTITVDDGSVFSRNTGVLRGEAKNRRHTNYLRPVKEVRADIARQEVRDRFASAKKSASGILSDMCIGLDQERLKKQCAEIRKTLIEMEQMSAAYSLLS